MAAEKKDTIYIDVDDEITAIIDKMSRSDSRIVALVLPKRATALQSIVNMKLLKRAADENSKSPVLITSEKGLLPLAGATGLYVAKNLNSKPEIPAGPDVAAVDDEELEAELEPEAGAAPKAAAAGVAAGAVAASKRDNDTIDMEQEAAAPAAAPATKAAKKAKKPKAAKGSQLTKIPNFDKFRKKIFIIAGAVIGGIIFLILAVVVLPKATIAIETNTESMDTSFEFTSNPAATTVDESAKVVPAQIASQKKEDTQTASATGQKDIGNKASGTVTMSARQCNSITTPSDVPAGSTVTSSGLNFVTSQAVSFTFKEIAGGCIIFTGGSTGVTAQNPGANYNLSSATFAVPGRGEVSASGSTSGGSSNVVKVVSAQDVEAAKSKIKANDDAVKQSLQDQLQKAGFFPIPESFKKSNETTTPSPGVDQEGSEVKVTYSADYSMVGVKRDDLKKLVEASLKDQIDTQRQQVQEDGLDNATFTVKSANQNGETVMVVSTKAAVGPDIDTEALKAEVAGKKSGDTENIVKELPGVKTVEVHYSPFWVSRTPKKASKITIEFKSAND